MNTGIAIAVFGNLINSAVILLTIVTAMALGIGLGYASIQGILRVFAGPRPRREPAQVIALPVDVSS